MKGQNKHKGPNRIKLNMKGQNEKVWNVKNQYENGIKHKRPNENSEM